VVFDLDVRQRVPLLEISDGSILDKQGRVIFKLSKYLPFAI